MNDKITAKDAAMYAHWLATAVMEKRAFIRQMALFVSLKARVTKAKATKVKTTRELKMEQCSCKYHLLYLFLRFY